MKSVASIADEILAREGGYVDDPDDLGGATKYGVTIHTMRRLGIDLTGDGQVSHADVQKLSLDDARKIFVDEYFVRPRISWLPGPLHPTVFDMQVNAGFQAVKLLQRLIGRIGFEVRVDGVIGPLTRDACRNAILAAPNHLVDAYGIERRSYYYALADRRPASRKYARRRDGGKGGWILRAESFVSRKYHLSEQEHRARTSTWV